MMWWQWLVAFCVGLAAVLGALGMLGKWVHRMWSTGRKLNRLLNRLLDQLLGDRLAEPPLPSLMDQLGDVRAEQARLAAALSEHVRWHGNPGGRPADPIHPFDGPTQRTYRSANAGSAEENARHRRAM